MDKATLKDYTTSLLAIIVISSAMYTGIIGQGANSPIPTIITAFTGIIIGYYFGVKTQ